FLTPDFAQEIATAARVIVAQTRTAEFAQHARTAIPAGLEVPGETPHPIFMQVDFGICEVDGHLTPRLIELQGFPSLYAFQLLLRGCVRATYPAIPPDWEPFFGGLDVEGYTAMLRRVLIADADLENVILLEIEP